MISALNFSVERSSNRCNLYGDSYWALGLPDGREVNLYADRFEITQTGAVVFWRDTKLVDGDREQLRAPERLLALPAGQWVHVYAASLLDGSPVAVAHLAAPRGEARPTRASRDR